MTEHDVRSAMALTQVLVKDLAFRLSIESAIAALFLWIGEFQLTAIWLLMVIPSEFAEVILSRAMNKADVVTKRHLFAQFAISIFGGAAWAVTGGLSLVDGQYRLYVGWRVDDGRCDHARVAEIRRMDEGCDHRSVFAGRRLAFHGMRAAEHQP